MVAMLAGVAPPMPRTWYVDRVFTSDDDGLITWVFPREVNGVASVSAVSALSDFDVCALHVASTTQQTTFQLVAADGSPLRRRSVRLQLSVDRW